MTCGRLCCAGQAHPASAYPASAYTPTMFLHVSIHTTAARVL